MAREYGFDYEFVQYKWPGWLHHQTEKQRIIWGYLYYFVLVITRLYYLNAYLLVLFAKKLVEFVYCLWWENCCWLFDIYVQSKYRMESILNHSFLYNDTTYPIQQLVIE